MPLAFALSTPQQLEARWFESRLHTPRQRRAFTLSIQVLLWSVGHDNLIALPCLIIVDNLNPIETMLHMQSILINVYRIFTDVQPCLGNLHQSST
jgi:hypothetical protein